MREFSQQLFYFRFTVCFISTGKRTNKKISQGSLFGNDIGQGIIFVGSEIELKIFLWNKFAFILFRFCYKYIFEIIVKIINESNI